MEKRFDSLTIFEFGQRFPTEEACLQYLSEKKWADGFVCPVCGHKHFCSHSKKRPYDRQCTKCHHISSPTSGTLFHKIKFSLLKAFWIIYYVSTSKHGVASTELSRKLGLRQKTCWGFKQKVMSAMASGGKNPLTGTVQVDETVVGGQEDNVKGRKNIKKKIVVFGIEIVKGGICRAYGKVIPNASAKSLGGFMRDTIDKSSDIQTDEWSGYKPLTSEFTNLTQKPSGKKGGNFPLMHRFIMTFKAWLRGTHHHVNNLQAYINEYTFRYNRHIMKRGIFENLLAKVIAHPPKTYKSLYA